jgi:hypothetical protein
MHHLKNSRYEFNLSLLILLFGFLISAVAEPDPLWEKAVTLMGANRQWVPGLLVTTVSQVSETEPAQQIWTRFFLNDSGKVEDQLIRFLEKGVDVTEIRRQKLAESRKKSADSDEKKHSISLSSISPFSPESHEKVRYQRVAQETQRGFMCDVFEYSQVTEDGDQLVGRSWLDSNTGIPIKVDYTMDPLPRFVKEMHTTILFNSSSPDSLYPIEIIMEGKGGILFLKKEIRTTIQLTEYWQLPEHLIE